MRLRRSQVRYSEALAPVTPYQAAAQAWDARIGSARQQASHWRLMAFGCLGLAALMAGGNVWQAGQSRITPYVVEVDRAGDVRAVGEAATPYRPTDAQIAHQLARFINNVRAVPIDPIVVRQQWLEAYEYATDRGAIALNDHARANDPFARVGQVSSAVEITSVVRASDSSFQVRWIERTYVNGSLSSTERWTAIISIILQPPRTEERLRRNPLGIFVNGLNWSRELNVGAESK